MKLLILLLTLSILLCSCASNKRWKSHHHTSRVRFDQDNAFCKMKSNETYNNSRGYQYASGGASVTNSSGYYDPATGTYSSSSKTKQEVDYIGNMADAVVRGSNADVAYKLCMQSKGYYQVESSHKVKKQNSSSINKVRAGDLGSVCEKDLECKAIYKCFYGTCSYRTDSKPAPVSMNSKGRSTSHRSDSSSQSQQIQPAVEHEDAATLFLQAGRHFTGDGVPKDYQKARALLQKAADLGYGKAQGALGEMYYTGQGGSKDYNKAINLSKAAAEQGLVKAQALVGRMYFKGEGVSKNMQEAAKWLLKAAKKGNVQAQGGLSEIYYETKDYRESVKWFRKAFLGMTQQQKEMVFNLNDDDTSKKLIGFYVLLETMVREKKDDAVQYRDKIDSKLSKESLKQAQQIVNEIQTILAGQIPNRQMNYSRFSVNVDPPDSKIRILNIKPEYSAKIALAYGKYHVEISKDGYKTKRQWVTLKQNTTNMSVVLQKNDTLPTIKNRLLVVQDLYRDGLMTEEEYHAKRKKIMSEL